jgi:3'-phosphoadenosine 5'-phosphosulfate sulfotransferase (PAPS reductase)/FAD synthetase
MKTFISFSGGVESTTMCVLYGKGAKAIWADTRAEHKKMYERINYVEKMLKELHGNDFEIIRLSNQKYEGLENYVFKQKFMPSPTERYCTRVFKIEPIDKFLKTQGDCTLMIGFNADEDRTGNYGLMSNVNYIYPLQEEGYTRKDCEDILNNYGLHPNFPAYMKRGGCRMCFFKSQNEYKALWYLNRAEFNEMLDFENKYQDKKLKFYSIMSNGKSLKQLAKECESEMFSDDILKMYIEHNKDSKSCGAFCHR